jgi:DNA-binding transcriptional LysR family regulator
MMNLNQLKAFYAVAKTGAFSKAAEELLVTDPAVFIQVRSLERCLGCKLLDKYGKDFLLTEIGRTLFSYAEEIFKLEEEVDRAVTEIRSLRSGELRVSTTKAIAQYIMPQAISLFQDLYPRIKVVLSEGSSDELVKGVMNHQVELALTARIPYPNRISTKPFSRDRIVVVVSPDSDLLEKEEVSLQDLSRLPIICRDVGSATRLATSAAFRRMGLKPSSTIESGNTEFIKDMVKKNKGYSLLASICVRADIRQGYLGEVRLKDRELTLDIDVIHRKGKTLSPAASTFVKFLKECCDPTDLARTADMVGERGKTKVSVKISPEDKKHLRLVGNK